MILIFLISAMLTGGCCSKQEAVSVPKTEPKANAPLSKADQLRQKAKVAEAANLIGYDGKAIRRDLNKIIDQQEQSAKQLEDLNNL
jgi:hypothetical protein